MTPLVQRRVALLVAAVAIAALGVGYRLYTLGIRDAGAWQSKAQRQQEHEYPVWARRGAILDRRGRELAVSMNCSSLLRHPRRVEDPERAAALLAPVLGDSRAKLLRKLDSERPFVYLARRLEPQTANSVRQLGLPIGGAHEFGFETEARRYYPQGRLGVHIVGFANIDQKGIAGIERVFDEQLRGDVTIRRAVLDGRRGAVVQTVQPPARDPVDVVLTIDLTLQHILERELDRAMRETGARWASALLMDPVTGEILALANRPTADPNRYGKFAADSRRNRAVTDMFEPGSTFKIVTAAAALEEGVVYPEQRFDCGNGSIRVAGVRIGDHKPFGVLSVREIIEKSSNTGVAQMAMRMPGATFPRIHHAIRLRRPHRRGLAR